MYVNFRENIGFFNKWLMNRKTLKPWKKKSINIRKRSKFLGVVKLLGLLKILVIFAPKFFFSLLYKEAQSHLLQQLIRILLMHFLKSLYSQQPHICKNKKNANFKGELRCLFLHLLVYQNFIIKNILKYQKNMSDLGLVKKYLTIHWSNILVF